MSKNHNIDDNNAPLLVDPAARKVTIPLTQRVFGAVGDHCSEQITFQIPNIIDGHDMPGCTRKYVSWRNVEGELGHDELRLKKAKSDSSLYSWTIRDVLTVAKGIVSFSLHFECYDDAGALLYRWSTTTCSDGEILDSVNAVMGAFKAIYLDGETLVFADATPVHEETIELRTGILPRDTLEITERGKFDVAAYAYVDNTALGEPIILTVENGVVKASANGREAELPLAKPSLGVNGSGLVTSSANGLNNQMQLTGSMITNVKADNIKKGIKVLDVTGTYDPIEGTAPTIDVTAGVVTATANGQTTQVNLETPIIGIADGVVTATANELTDTHTLVAADVPGLAPDVITKGVKILDKTGTCYRAEDLSVPLTWSTVGTLIDGFETKGGIEVWWTSATNNDTLYPYHSTDTQSGTIHRKVAKGSYVFFKPLLLKVSPDITGTVVPYFIIRQSEVQDLEPVFVEYSTSGEDGYLKCYDTVVFRVTGDRPTITLRLERHIDY